MHLTINLDRESDGRWIADIPELNLLLYGESREDAIAKAKDATREIIADRIAHGEPDYPFSFHRSEEVGPAMLA